MVLRPKPQGVPPRKSPRFGEGGGDCIHFCHGAWGFSGVERPIAVWFLEQVNTVMWFSPRRIGTFQLLWGKKHYWKWSILDIYLYLIYPLTVVIFHSYVSLPEGYPICHAISSDQGRARCCCSARLTSCWRKISGWRWLRTHRFFFPKFLGRNPPKRCD